MRRPISRRTIEALRKKAAGIVKATGDEAPSSSTQDLAALVEELRIHQVELEIQNHELQEARKLAEALQTRYFRHFDLAPVGMVRISDKGIVLEANVIAAAMLATDRRRLNSGRVVFAAHVATESQITFQAHLQKALASSRMESCEIRLRGPGGEAFVRMQSVGCRSEDDAMNLLVTITDLTAHKQAEDAITVLNAELEGRVRDRTTELGEANKALENTIYERQRLENEILDISERERRRIGQDLHDDLCQQLAGIALLGGVLGDELKAKGDAAAAKKVIHIARLLQSAAVSARDIARGLHPVEMDSNGLEAALHDLADRAGKEVRCRFEKSGSISIPDRAAALSLFRIAQEAVVNALKHAQASEIVISLAQEDTGLFLRVSDNGMGLPEGPVRAKSMGRHIMEYRATAIGATLTLEERPGGGTQVVCSLPNP